MQQPRRFQAPTMAEAYEQVRHELGDAAVILSTRKAFAPGLFGQPGRQFVEVVARIPREAPAAGEAQAEAERPTLEQDQAAHDLVRSIAEAAATAPADLPADMPADLPIDLPAATPSRTPLAAGNGAWSHQLDQMRSMLETLVSDRLDQRLQAAPAALGAVRQRLVRHGLTAALAAHLLDEVDATASDDEQAVAAAVEQRLAAQLPPTVSVNTRGNRATFLVGPGGAGKTTLAVRMALDLQQQGVHAVIAGTDVNRAGAPQQLMAFAGVTGLDIRLCYAPAELEAILAEPGVDTVIVDTPGHNGLRRDRMVELSSFLQVARQRLVLLTIPATMKGADLTEVVSAFSAVGLDGAAVTRCDETTHFGELTGVLLESAIGVALTTRSDQVSDTPAAGDNVALAEATVRGQWRPGQPAGVRRPATAGRALARVG